MRSTNSSSVSGTSSSRQAELYTCSSLSATQRRMSSSRSFSQSKLAAALRRPAATSLRMSIAAHVTVFARRAKAEAWARTPCIMPAFPHPMRRETPMSDQALRDLLRAQLDDVKAKGLYKRERQLQGPQGSAIRVG